MQYLLKVNISFVQMNFIQHIFKLCDSLSENVVRYSLSSYFHGIRYKQSQLPVKFNVCLSICHGIITNMYDVIHMFFLQNL